MASKKTPERTARPYVPEGKTLPTLQEAVQDCEGCDLYQDATQAVFGEGPPDAPLVIVGEQPGDQEDKKGHPFVGPAGRILDEALIAVGIPRERVYVTNAVKHFKWKKTGKGKRRLHDKPKPWEMRACRPWLEAELEVIRPKILLLLGATAAQTVFGADFRLTRHRGELLVSELADLTFVTVHPSSVLRAGSPEDRAAAKEAFIADLRAVAEHWRRLEDS